MGGHVSVMLQEAVAALEVKKGGVYTERYETQFRQALDAVREAGTGYPEAYGPSDVY